MSPPLFWTTAFRLGEHRFTSVAGTASLSLCTTYTAHKLFRPILCTCSDICKCQCLTLHPFLLKSFLENFFSGSLASLWILSLLSRVCTKSPGFVSLENWLSWFSRFLSKSLQETVGIARAEGWVLQDAICTYSPAWLWPFRDCGWAD